MRDRSHLLSCGGRDGADRGRIVGILYSRDFYDALLDTDDDPSRNLRPLRREPLIVAETHRVCEVFELMQLKCAHMALVIHEHGALAGFVTIDDLLSEDGG